MRIIEGDLWNQAGWKVIPTNLTGVMGRGVARQARDRYSWLESEYRNRCRTPEGNLTVFPEAGIICLAVKGHWREKASLQLITDNVIKLEWTMTNGHTDDLVALPLIGCGFGELDPLPVLHILARELTDDRFTLVLPPENIAEKYPESFRSGARTDRTVRQRDWWDANIPDGLFPPDQVGIGN